MEYILKLCRFSTCRVNGQIKIGTSKESTTYTNKEQYNYIYNKITDCKYITKEDFILINDMTNDEKMKLFTLYNETMNIIIHLFTDKYPLYIDDSVLSVESSNIIGV